MAGKASSPPEISPAKVGWRKHYRLVISQLPTISLFEDYVDADLLEAAYALEGRTNPRLRAQAGELSLVAKEDYVMGPGASPVMAAFTHIGRPSRFTDGSFGVYYAGNSIATAIEEVRFHKERFLRATNEPPTTLTLRSYIGTIKKPLRDIRAPRFSKYVQPALSTYTRCQRFSLKLKDVGVWGLIYPSVRYESGQCVAFYRPPAVGLPTQGKHFSFSWDGKRISEVLSYSIWKPVRQ